MAVLPEILAPVGGMEQLYAAVRCGADAVYLGTKHFNARRNAANFTEEEFADVVKYCHIRGVDVNVTINTMIYDDEMSQMEEAAELVASAGVDGVIIQDLAVLDLFRRKYPQIKRIASTQMAVHNRDGAKFVEDLGFDTLVLARELSKDEIRDIIENTSLSTEAFIHGAHCMSVSGMCYVSSMLGERSGNRGLCAQPCRLDWKCGDRDYVLSLKDLSLIHHVQELAEIGVDSFKIEGRMKRPEYVAAAVTACRKALHGEPYDENVLKDVFSRSGFTDGYFTGKRDATMFGVRTKDDVLSSGSILKDLKKLYEKEQQVIPVDIVFRIEGETLYVEMRDDRGNVATTELVGVEKAQKHSTTSLEVSNSLSKLGGTPFYARQTEVVIPEGVFLAASSINQMRRDAVAQLEELRGKRKECEKRKRFVSAETVTYPKGAREAWARFSNIEQLQLGSSFDRIIVPEWIINPENIDVMDPAKTIIELPAVIFPEDYAGLMVHMEELEKRGFRQLYVNNPYGIEIARRFSMEFHGGFGMNIANGIALNTMLSCGAMSQTVSMELSNKRIEALERPLPLSMIVYGKLPLMRFRNCPVRASIGCGKCLGKGQLKDRFGNTFQIECCDKRTSSLLNSVPIYIMDKRVPDIDIQIYWFTTETPAEIKNVIDTSEKGLIPDFKRTRGLYYREVM